MAVTLKHVDATGDVWETTWSEGTSTKVEPDDCGGLLQVVRDKDGRMLAGLIAGLVLKVNVRPVATPDDIAGYTFNYQN